MFQNQDLKKINQSPKSMRRNMSSNAGDSRQCFYCRAPGNLIALCPVLKRKEAKNFKGVGLIKSMSISETSSEVEAKVDDRFLPFISKGFVSFTGEEKDKVPVTILRDTGAYQSFLLESVLPLSEQTYCGSDILVWGIKISVVRAPLHMVHLHSAFLTERIKVAVRPRLPIDGI